MPSHAPRMSRANVPEYYPTVFIVASYKSNFFDTTPLAADSSGPKGPQIDNQTMRTIGGPPSPGLTVRAVSWPRFCRGRWNERRPLMPRKAAKRELINTGRDKRYVRRDPKGRFHESD